MILYNNSDFYFYCDNNLCLNDLYPIECYVNKTEKNKKFSVYIQNCYALLIIKSGSVIVKSQRSNHTLKENQLMIFDGYNSYTVLSVSSAEYIVIKFSGARAEDFSEYANTIYNALGLYDELHSFIVREDRHDVFLTSFLFRIYGEISAYKAPSSGQKKLNRYVKMVIDNINNSFLSPGYSLSDVAESLDLNQKYLASLFKNEVGISMREYLKRKRLETAYELLSQGYKLKDVTWRCGIHDASNLSEMFKKYYGIRPSEVYKRRY